MWVGYGQPRRAMIVSLLRAFALQSLEDALFVDMRSIHLWNDLLGQLCPPVTSFAQLC